MKRNNLLLLTSLLLTQTTSVWAMEKDEDFERKKTIESARKRFQDMERAENLIASGKKLHAIEMESRATKIFGSDWYQNILKAENRGDMNYVVSSFLDASEKARHKGDRELSEFCSMKANSYIERFQCVEKKEKRNNAPYPEKNNSTVKSSKESKETFTRKTQSHKPYPSQKAEDVEEIHRGSNQFTLFLHPKVNSLDPSENLPEDLGYAQEFVEPSLKGSKEENLLPRKYPLRGKWYFQEEQDRGRSIATLKISALFNNQQRKLVYQRELPIDHMFIKSEAAIPGRYHFDGDKVYQERISLQYWKNPHTGKPYQRNSVFLDAEIPTHQGHKVIYVRPFALGDEPSKPRKEYKGKYLGAGKLSHRVGLPAGFAETLIYSDGNRIYLPRVTQELWKKKNSGVGFLIASYKEENRLDFLPQAKIQGGFFSEGLYQLRLVKDGENSRIEKWHHLSDQEKIVIVTAPKGVSSIPGVGAHARRFIPDCSSKTEVIDLQENIRKTQEAIKKSADLYHHVTNVVILVGPSDAGKSTLIQGLAGKKLVGKDCGRGYICLDAEDPLPDFKIGHDCKSETKIPGFWYDKGNNRLIIDCPGFKDSEGGAADIVNAFAIKSVFPNASVKVVLVADASSITSDNGTHYAELLNQMTALYKDEKQLQQGLSVVLTKTYVAPQVLLKPLFSLLNVEKTVLTERSKNLLVDLNKNRNRFFLLPKPQDEGDYHFDRDGLLNCINATKYAQKPAINITVNADAEILAVDLAQGLNKYLINYLETEGSQRIINYCTQKIDKHTRTLQDLREEFLRLIKTLKNLPSDSTTNFMNALKNIIEIDTIRKTIETLDFIKIIKKTISYNIDGWKAALNKVIEKISILTLPPQVECKNGELSVKGVLVGMGAVYKALKDYPAPKYLNVYSLNTLFLDGGLQREGLSVRLIAPQWKLISPIMINLSGANGDTGAHGDNPGEDGKPGLPGKNGGHFFGLADTIIHPELLNVNTSGGGGGSGGDGKRGANGLPGAKGANGKNGDKGADGKNGDKGADGADGKNGDKGADGANGNLNLVTRQDPLAQHDRYRNPRRGRWHHYEGNMTYYEDQGKLGSPGTAGTEGQPGKDGNPGTDGQDGKPGTDGKAGGEGNRGGNGGRPGQGGPGGHAGKAIINPSLSGQNTISNHGTNGPNGNAGLGGSGGAGGPGGEPGRGGPGGEPGRGGPGGNPGKGGEGGIGGLHGSNCEGKILKNRVERCEYCGSRQKRHDDTKTTLSHIPNPNGVRAASGANGVNSQVYGKPGANGQPGAKGPDGKRGPNGNPGANGEPGQGLNTVGLQQPAPQVATNHDSLPESYTRYYQEEAAKPNVSPFIKVFRGLPIISNVPKKSGVNHNGSVNYKEAEEPYMEKSKKSSRAGGPTNSSFKGVFEVTYKGVPQHFNVYDVDPDGDCGYHALKISREEVANMLSDNLHNPVIRELIGEEIEDNFADVCHLFKHLKNHQDFRKEVKELEKDRQKILGRFSKVLKDNALNTLQDLLNHCLNLGCTTENEVITMLDLIEKEERLEREKRALCTDRETIRCYIKHYIRPSATEYASVHLGKDNWMNSGGNRGPVARTSTAALAHILGKNLAIWGTDRQLVCQYTCNPKSETIHLLLIGNDHFNGLQPQHSQNQNPSVNHNGPSNGRWVMNKNGQWAPQRGDQ